MTLLLLIIWSIKPRLILEHCKFVLECFDLFNIDKNSYIDNDSDSDDNDNDNNDMIVKNDFVTLWKWCQLLTNWGTSYVIEDSGMTAKEWHWTEFAMIAMFKYPSGLGAVSSPKCSLPGLLSKELLIFDNKSSPTCAFISCVWWKFQINPLYLQHSPQGLIKNIVLKASGRSLPHFGRIRSYALFLVEVPRTWLVKFF